MVISMEKRDSALPALIFNKVTIRDRNETLSLTDMWKASGSPDGRAPADWRALASSIEFADHVAEILNAGKSGNELFQVIRGGKSPGTWAHWQIGLAYAKYLSPEFHMWCNTVVRERMEGKSAPAAIPDDLIEQIRRTDGIARMLAHKVTELERSISSMSPITIVTPSHIDHLVNDALDRRGNLRRTGRTAGQIWRANGYPPIKNVSIWFGNRLRAVGCALNARTEDGDRTSNLFDPDKARTWLDNGGDSVVNAKIAERQGQKSLFKLVPRE